jgi:anthranilate synthase component 1
MGEEREREEPPVEAVRRAASETGFPCAYPLLRVVSAEGRRPTDVYASLRGSSTNTFLLESAEVGKTARYSFLGGGEETLRLKDGVLVFRGKGETVDDPMDHFRRFLGQYKLCRQKRLPPFSGGLLGYLSYDLVRYFEELAGSVEDDLGHPDAELLFTTDLIVFDHWREEVLLLSNLLLEGEGGIEEAYREGVRRLDRMEGFLRSSEEGKPRFREGPLRVTSNVSKEAFEAAVEKAKEYIRAGDIFQVVLSQRFECTSRSVDPLNLYLVLKEINPSPYMYFLEFGGLKVVGSSPEILVRVDGSRVVVRPIAGTRPRGANIVEDEALSREMVNDPKERAEHVMLVDLGRNDIGKVSRFGSVVVDEFMTIEKYSHVQHIVSNVVGELQEGKDAYDALAATFPAGTVTGAPKVRAMEIIEELEPTRRGIYAGTVGYFSFNGNMDFAITIRTIVLQGGKAYVQVGAGIVADSIPEREYQETVNKGKGMLRALELAGGEGK